MPEQAKLVVDSPKSTGTSTWSQDWHEYADLTTVASNLRYQITPSGFAWWSEVVGTTSKNAVLCEFVPPVVLVPSPIRVGYSFSGHGTCSAPTSLSLSGRITGTTAMTIDGSKLTAIVVVMDVTQPGSKDSASETAWFDPQLGLNLREVISQSGGSGSNPYHSSLTRILTTAKPS